MGKTRGTRANKGLVDMAIVPKQYKPPAVPPAVERNFTADLTDTDLFKIREVVWHKLVVDFAIMQLHLRNDEWHHVARIDCCHGMIHRHQFDHEGNDLDGHVEINVIPGDDPKRWEMVQDGYYAAMGTMYDEWEANLQRWRNGN